GSKSCRGCDVFEGALPPAPVPSAAKLVASLDPCWGRANGAAGTRDPGPAREPSAYRARHVGIEQRAAERTLGGLLLLWGCPALAPHTTHYAWVIPGG